MVDELRHDDRARRRLRAARDRDRRRRELRHEHRRHDEGRHQPERLVDRARHQAAGAAAAVSVSASASDGGSGVASVAFQYRQSGGGSWAGIGSASSAPYQATWDTTALTSGAHDLQAVVTDAAGNQFTTGVVTVVVDSTAPGVTLNDGRGDPTGTVSLSASTTGDANVVAFSYSPAGASSWTTIGSDGSAPYGVGFNTTTTPDGMYDLRAVVSDAVGNTSSSIRPSAFGSTTSCRC